MTYIVALVLLALICFAIALVVYTRRVGKKTNLLILMIAAGCCSAIPWFALWGFAHVNQQRCPSQGPCRLDGMQMIGEVLFLYATPTAFFFGAISVFVIALVKRK
jgi:hypothetical protein